MRPEEENSDNIALIERFDSLYISGGFGYKREDEERILFSVFDSTGVTLLDVGCGDGFWTEILETKYVCTGIDIAPEGLEIAQKRCPLVPFYEGDFMTYDFKGRMFDIVFMRSPSFLNFPPESDRFKAGIEKAISICKQDIWYIKWSVPPYDRYDDASYIHDPVKIEKALSLYGRVTMMYTPNYFYAKLSLK